MSSDDRVTYGCHVNDDGLTRFRQLRHDLERPSFLESRRAVVPSPVKLPQLGSRGRLTYEILRKSTKALSEVKVNTIVMSQRFCFLFFFFMVLFAPFAGVALALGAEEPEDEEALGWF